MLNTLQGIDERLGKIEAKAKEAEKKPTPPVPASPDRGKTESQSSYVLRLKQYAAQQAMTAKRLELAHKYGVPADELSGEYESPEAMEQHALVLAQQKELQALKQKVDALESPQSSSAITPDTGGATGTTTPVNVLQQRYADAREAAKRGDHQKAATLGLQAIYGDPSKVVK